MNSTGVVASYLPSVEAELRRLLAEPDAAVRGHYGIMHYHMGWVDEQLRPAEFYAGKQVRPLVCLLSCAAAGGDPGRALPAAAAVEMVHNFSLIHDDIEDNSASRRGRATAWTIFGLAQACNAGDGMFAIAHQALGSLASAGVPAERVLQSYSVFDSVCRELTEGQFLDMAFETLPIVEEEEYFRMIASKTGALLAASAELGAVAAEASSDIVAAFRRFGRALGLAFQLRDDYLGIWGSEELTGKSTASDVLSKKKSLPVIYAMGNQRCGEEVRARYTGPAFAEADVPEIVALLERCGAREHLERRTAQATREAHEALSAADGLGDAAALAELHGLLDSLLTRET